MDISRRQKGAYDIVVLKGPVKSFLDSSRFKKMIKKVLADESLHVVVNFSEAESLNSDFINVIVSTHHQLQKLGGEMSLVGADPKITETLELVGVHMMMSVYVDEESLPEI